MSAPLRLPLALPDPLGDERTAPRAVATDRPPHRVEDIPALIDFASFDYIVVAYSGGKDSVACVLNLLERGAPREKIELWHHLIDGREGSTLMDWPVTDDYCRQFAQALGLPLYLSWKVGGFEGEMLRKHRRTLPMCFETPEGTVERVGGTAGKESTRLKWPAKAASLNTRWCSAYLKIQVGEAAITNQPRFKGKRTLFVTGERAEESRNRANYCGYERHKTDRRDSGLRHVDHYRPIHQWSEAEVWAILERWRIRPHPAYQFVGRTSCMSCIFGSPDQWATIRRIAPAQFDRIRRYEVELAHTIDAKLTVDQMADRGTPAAAAHDAGMVALALSPVYTPSIIVPPEEPWTLPPGAYGGSDGPP